MSEPCNTVLDINCKAAPGTGSTRAKCFHCGHNVCTSCSRIKRNRYKMEGFPKRVRVCASCLHDHYGVEL